MLMKKFVALDFYGERVGVNYAGKSTYQTKVGAIVSIISIMLILIYTTTRIH